MPWCYKPNSVSRWRPLHPSAAIDAGPVFAKEAGGWKSPVGSIRKSPSMESAGQSSQKLTTFCKSHYNVVLWKKAKLDSMCWFSHRRIRAREDCSRQNRTQAAVNVHCRHPRRPHNGVCCCVQRTAYSARVALPCTVNGDDSAVFCSQWVTLTFDTQIRTRARFLYIAPNRQVSSS